MGLVMSLGYACLCGLDDYGLSCFRELDLVGFWVTVLISCFVGLRCFILLGIRLSSLGGCVVWCLR